eukprot:s728_g9.t1
MEEKALWQYTRYVYSNQVDTYLFGELLLGIAERVEEQWQISISPDDLDLRMGNYWRQHYGLDTYPIDTTSTPPSSPTVPADALDTPIAAAVQLIRAVRNMPLAGSIEEYNQQLLALVAGSDFSPRLSSVQLETLAIQFHQLSQATLALEQQDSAQPDADDDSPDGHHLEDMEDDTGL